MITQNQFHSYNLGELPKGCQFCVRGEKLVLFVTGICPRKCYFCPLSDKKYGKEVSFANEREIKSDPDLILEAELMQAKGAGITGGDPLARMDKTLRYIRLLKEKFGAEFHLHLYTSLNLVDEKKLRQLHDAGLDEIRFHLDLDSEELWEKMELAANFEWDVGVEIPLLPGKEKETRKLMEFIKGKAKFLNLNELEIADNSFSKLGEMGCKTKDELSYAVKGSLEMGLSLMECLEKKRSPYPVHLCTAQLKDGIQLANRLIREAELARKPFDIVDEEGMLTRGALYLPELSPGFDYRNKLEKADREKVLEKLNFFLSEIKEKFKLRENQICIDESKLRLLLSAKKARSNAAYFTRMGLKAAIVVEYPTADQLEMEVEFVK